MLSPEARKAIAILKATRQELIAAARGIANDLMVTRGKIHVREVWFEMKVRGLLQAGIADYWLSGVFHCGDYEWTGEWALPYLPDGSLYIVPIKSAKSDSEHAPTALKLWRMKAA